MAVYTKLDTADLDALLTDYAIGELIGFAEIGAGITNTNYFLDTTQGRWVLTLFETMTAQELPFFMRVMDHLAARGIPGAHPVARRDGNFLTTVQDRPAALVYCLQGESVTRPGPAQCAALGTVVAAMHQAAATLDAEQANSRGLAWIYDAAKALKQKLEPATLALLRDEIDVQTRLAGSTDWQHMPRAVIHADLFRDNVLFEANRVSGIIDFYYACHDYLLFDLAIICNDWCFDAGLQFLPERWQAFINSYCHERALTASEQRVWPAMLRAAALRFWTSRLYDYHFPIGKNVDQHDPKPFEQLLRLHREHTLPQLP